MKRAGTVVAHERSKAAGLWTVVGFCASFVMRLIGSIAMMISVIAYTFIHRAR